MEILSVVRVIDGDTFDALVRTHAGQIDGWQITASKVVRIRPVHLDTPERGEKGYDEATEDLADWLYGWDSMNGYLVARLDERQQDTFGRYLAEVHEPHDRSATLSDYMIREKGWPPYTGR